MTIKQDFITPDPLANPNAEGKQEVPVAPISAWPMGSVSSVLAFPTELDEERLRKAIARAASFWPVIAGRFVKSSTPGAPEFSISLTSSPIPFSTQTTTDEYPYADKHVIQQSLGEYAPELAPDFVVPGSDAALVSFRFSKLASGGSVLGVIWGHILGDAAAFSRLLEDISLLYNMPSADLGDDMPTFEPHVRIPKATEEVLRDYHLDILEPVPVEQMIKGYTHSAADSKSFTVTLTRGELKHITSVRAQGESLSDNDLLTGWWISVLERAGENVNNMVQTINYRSFHNDHKAFPPNLPTLVANVAQMRKIPLPPNTQISKPSARALTIARAIRGGMSQLRSDPEVMLDWLSNAAHEIGRAAHEGKAQCLVPAPGGVVVNSNLRYDWAITFGQPSSNYHTNLTILRFLRVFQANSRDGADIDPTVGKGEKDIELGFRVEPEIADKVQSVIDDDRAKWERAGPADDHSGDHADGEDEIRTFNSGNNLTARLPWGVRSSLKPSSVAVGPRSGEPTSRLPWGATSVFKDDSVAVGPRKGEPASRLPYGATSVYKEDSVAVGPRTGDVERWKPWGEEVQKPK